MPQLRGDEPTLGLNSLRLGLCMERQGNTMKGNATHGKEKEIQDNHLR
jgi:hypothetical protein